MADVDTTQAEGDGGSDLLKSIPSIMWQRRWLIGVPFAVIAIASTVAAFVIKPVYRSEATIVIESAQLPADLVPSSVNDLIDQRIARVRQRVLSRPDLIQLIRSNNLYPDHQDEPLSAIIERMKKATNVAPISASLEPGGRGGSNTIAFTISFDYPEPGPAQLVMQQYVNRFLELDADQTSAAATNAAGLLEDQAAGLQRQIQEVEGKITAIKSANGALLAAAPTLTDSSAGDAGRIDSDIAGLIAENVRLQAAARAPVQDADVTSLESQLRSLKSRLADTHPDVLALQSQLDAARKAASARGAGPNDAQAAIAANNARIAALRGAKGMILSQSSSAMALRARAPVVQEQVSQLEDQADGLRSQLAAISGRLQGAQVSARMQSDQKGERLAVADPPVVPDEPVWPNRPLLIAGGVIGGLAVGLGLALLLELLFRPIRGTDALRRVTGRAPLVVIPELDRKPALLVRLMERWSRRKVSRKPLPAR